MKRVRRFIPLFLILLIGAFFRFSYLNWDGGFHLHPDERAIVLYTLHLSFPSTILAFFSSQSSWNPQFFAYGSFPLYLLYLVGVLNHASSLYDFFTISGRYISAIFDIATIVVLFFLGRNIFGEKIGFLAAFLYAVSVLPIQLSHFYAVDTLLTFFILTTLYGLIKFYEKASIRYAVLVGVGLGLSLATKISALVLGVAFGVTLLIDFLIVFLRSFHRPTRWFPHVPKLIKRLVIDGISIIFVAIVTFLIVEPFAFIDWNEFLSQNLQQAQMTKDAFTFPYTLQYVGKPPYLYELQNVFLFGLGPVIGLLSFLGVVYVTVHACIYRDVSKKTLILLSFFWAYFFVVGNFAIGFMRYMLPLYPLFALFGAVFLVSMLQHPFFSKKPHTQVVIAIFLILFLIWPLSFSAIYRKPHTRVLASEWIHSHIPSGYRIAVEHWDDNLPLYGQERYHMVTLPLYDPDTSYKWEQINAELSSVDYIILSSNRLYVPLQKLTNCKELPIGKCYPMTADYYHKLFSGTRGFQKVAEFSSYPTLPFLNKEIVDDAADESFTVYDHPRVLIFKRIP